ncbi:MAG: hypothetical protein E7168_03355 [Firmicutes bacterium]|nr:hypothetical protein [Bacillota bacterium]
MKKAIKTYFPFAISILFMIAYVSLVVITILLTLKENVVFLEPNIWFLYISIFISVPIILIEMIIYMIHAIKNKELKNNGLWVALIYIFNVFVIPYYHLKYVIKDEKTTIKTKIYILIMVLACLIGAFIPRYLVEVTNNTNQVVENKIFNTPDGIFELNMPSSYNLKEVGTYDLYLSDSKRQINTGVFTYSLSKYQTTKQEILDEQVNFILETREETSIIEEKTNNLPDGKLINTKRLIGTKDNNKCVYQLSVITTINNPDYAVFIIQVTLEEDYKEYEEELNKILYDSKIISECKKEELS